MHLRMEIYTARGFEGPGDLYRIRIDMSVVLVE